MLELVDFTRLNGANDHENVKKFIAQAIEYKKQGFEVASICIDPLYVALAKDLLANTDIRIATVANFPEGNQSLATVEASILQSLKDGADEIDVVIDYRALKSGNIEQVRAFLARCRELTKGRVLKVIIESSELTIDEIKTATRLVAESGADFVKTSTGKVKSGGATVEAVQAICEALAENPTWRNVGIKMSGGVADPATARKLLAVVEKAKGKDWISPNHVRIGASQLAEKLINEASAQRSKAVNPQDKSNYGSPFLTASNAPKAAPVAVSKL